MKYIICGLMLCLGITTLQAQEVQSYNSSGHTANHPIHHKKKKGFDPDKLIIGGSAILNFGDGYYDLGLSPTVGYKFSKTVALGIGAGIESAKLVESVDNGTGVYTNTTYKFRNVYPDLWARITIYKRFYALAEYQYDFLHYSREASDQYGSISPYNINPTISTLLLGAGFRIPIAGRVSAMAEVYYDVLQNQYSPDYQQGPGIRIGIVAGF